MRAVRRLFVLAVVTLATAVLPSVPVSAQTGPSLEAELLSLINQGRREHGKSTLLSHVGLLAQARIHSQEMSAGGRLNHDGASQRMHAATADPSEANGGSDDGFTYRWCENVGFVGDADARDVARYLYDAWKNSPSHRECMFDEPGKGINVIGVGLFLDGNGRWWATMEANTDTTPPGSAPKPVVTPAPSSAPQTNTNVASAVRPFVREPDAPAPRRVAAPTAPPTTAAATATVAPEPSPAPTPVPASASAELPDTVAAPFEARRTTTRSSAVPLAAGGAAGVAGAVGLLGFVRFLSARSAPRR